MRNVFKEAKTPVLKGKKSAERVAVQECKKGKKLAKGLAREKMARDYPDAVTPPKGKNPEEGMISPICRVGTANAITPLNLQAGAAHA